MMSGSLRRNWPYALTGLLAIATIASGWIMRNHFAPVGPGTVAPEFTAVDLEGREVSLSELRGEVVLLNIWATWCPPCREEMPSMQRLHEQLGSEGLRIVAVSIDAGSGLLDRGGRKGGNVRAFVREHELTFDIWHDPKGEIQRVFQTTGVPESFVIDRNGLIVRKVAGATEWDAEAYVELFRRLLNE